MGKGYVGWQRARWGREGRNAMQTRLAPPPPQRPRSQIFVLLSGVRLPCEIFAGPPPASLSPSTPSRCHLLSVNRSVDQNQHRHGLITTLAAVVRDPNDEAFRTHDEVYQSLCWRIKSRHPTARCWSALRTAQHFSLRRSLDRRHIPGSRLASSPSSPPRSKWRSWQTVSRHDMANTMMMERRSKHKLPLGLRCFLYWREIKAGA